MKGTEFEKLTSQINTLSDLMTVQSKELSEIKTELSSVKTELCGYNKRLSFVEITLNGLDKKVDKLMQWTLADQEGIDYTKKRTALCCLYSINFC